LGSGEICHGILSHAALAPVARLERESRVGYVDPYLVAVVYLGLTEGNNTYAWLDRAYAARSSFLISIATDPKWSASRGDRRFEEIWNRMTETRHVATLSAPVGAPTLR
jgi:hypothetical protein